MQKVKYRPRECMRSKVNFGVQQEKVKVNFPEGCHGEGGGVWFGPK
jgi:hypothetical protein